MNVYEWIIFKGSINLLPNENENESVFWGVKSGLIKLNLVSKKSFMTRFTQRIIYFK